MCPLANCVNTSNKRGKTILTLLGKKLMNKETSTPPGLCHGVLRDTTLGNGQRTKSAANTHTHVSKTDAPATRQTIRKRGSHGHWRAGAPISNVIRPEDSVFNVGPETPTFPFASSSIGLSLADPSTCQCSLRHAVDILLPHVLSLVLPRHNSIKAIVCICHTCCPFSWCLSWDEPGMRVLGCFFYDRNLLCPC